MYCIMDDFLPEGDSAVSNQIFFNQNVRQEQIRCRVDWPAARQEARPGAHKE